MDVRFDFTDSPPESGMKHTLSGVGFYIYDDENNLVLAGEVGAGGIVVTLSPGRFCITGTKYINQTQLYFGQLSFIINETYPPRPDNIMPPINWDVRFFVYMEIIDFNEEEGLPEIPCSDMHPSEGGDNSWLWWLLLLISTGVMGSH